MNATEYQTLATEGVAAEGYIACALRGGYFIKRLGLFIASGPRGVFHSKPAAEVADFRIL